MTSVYPLREVRGIIVADNAMVAVEEERKDRRRADHVVAAPAKREHFEEFGVLTVASPEGFASDSCSASRALKSHDISCAVEGSCDAAALLSEGGVKVLFAVSATASAQTAALYGAFSSSCTEFSRAPYSATCGPRLTWPYDVPLRRGDGVVQADTAEETIRVAGPPLRSTSFMQTSS